MSKANYRLIFSVTRIDSDVEEVREEADLEGSIDGLDVESTFEDTYQVTYHFKEETDEKAIETANELIDDSAFDIHTWSLLQDHREVANEEDEEI
jgi:hypothetical protein